MTQTIITDTILDKILAQTATDLAVRKQRVPLERLQDLTGDRPASSRFSDALAAPGLSLIAEIKKASPSKGKFPVSIDVSALAGEYAMAGANAISVLTDEPFFQGSLADLRCASEAVSSMEPPPPLLRKDFVIDEYQIFEAADAGASAILLIVAALPQQRLVELRKTAESIGLEALVEVHDDEEVARALDSGASIIGINNRDLRRFSVDLGTSERLAQGLAGKVLVVGESGISTDADSRRMAAAGVDAILVGETVVLAGDRKAKIAELKLLTD